MALCCFCCSVDRSNRRIALVHCIWQESNTHIHTYLLQLSQSPLVKLKNILRLVSHNVFNLVQTSPTNPIFLWKPQLQQLSNNSKHISTFCQPQSFDPVETSPAYKTFLCRNSTRTAFTKSTTQIRTCFYILLATNIQSSTNFFSYMYIIQIPNRSLLQIMKSDKVLSLHTKLSSAFLLLYISYTFLI